MIVRGAKSKSNLDSDSLTVLNETPFFLDAVRALQSRRLGWIWQRLRLNSPVLKLYDPSANTNVRLKAFSTADARANWNSISVVLHIKFNDFFRCHSSIAI